MTKERMPRKHLAVDSRYLVRQRLDRGRIYRHVGVEQMRQPDPCGLRRQPEDVSISGK